MNYIKKVTKNNIICLLIFLFVFSPIYMVQAEDVLENNNNKSEKTMTIEKNINDNNTIDNKATDSNAAIESKDKEILEEDKSKAENLEENKDSKTEYKTSSEVTEKVDKNQDEIKNKSEDKNEEIKDKNENKEDEITNPPIIVQKINFVDVGRDWVITFNRNLDMSSINKNNLKIYSSNNEFLDFDFICSKDEKSIIIRLKSKIEQNKIYNLYINQGIKSKSGEVLKNPLVIRYSNLSNKKSENVIIDKQGNVINGCGKVEYGSGVICDGTFKNGEFISGKVTNRKNEVWPRNSGAQKYSNHAKYYAKMFKTSDYVKYLGEYDSDGCYLNFQNNPDAFKITKDHLKYDGNGIPMVNYYGKYQYNPVTTAQYALYCYSKYIKNKSFGIDKFLKATDKLIELQNSIGAYHYGFEFKYYNKTLPIGWMSSMAQGQALSAFSRAYKLTGDEKYLIAGNKSFNILTTPIEKGGTMGSLKYLNPSLKNNIIFEEYIDKPETYTLNGYMFTLIGVHDWSTLKPDDGSYQYILASDYFKRGIKTLKSILPYYDIGGFTTYDLAYMTQNRGPNMSGRYHSVHIFLLNAMHSITGDSQFKNYYDKWRSYML